ncbi:MAG: replicative DNA helicase [Cytophagales bacterium]|nr:replicative DNA helicase [Bernardetiaceae bacterium]MDW8204184.1 replicative DNA helicase [Cytophagales bacterium]
MKDDKPTVRKSKRAASATDIALLGTGKLPPQAVELEEAVLGALMLERNALTEVIEILQPAAFYKEAHQAIYKAILALFNKSEPIDLLTVVNQLRSEGTLELAGGTSYVTLLTTKVNSAANIVYHARIIAEQYMKREMISIAGRVLQEAFEDTTDVFELIDQTENAIFSLAEINIRRNYQDMRSIMGSALRELEAKKAHKDGLTGVPSGFAALDRITSGWQKSDLIILAARPGMGKTAFVLSALRNAAVDFGKPVAIFSLEMSSVQLVNRLISAEAELESQKLKTGKLADYEWEQIVHKTTRLSAAPIFIDDTPALTVLELRAKARRLKSQHDIQLLIIDYLQLMSGDGTKNTGGNREQEIASISRSLKQLAKELDIPVIALSQLSRAVETRGGDKRPQLSDLRESGAIEQDADMVIFLYRPEYYGITEDADGKPTKDLGEVIIAKNRNGSLESVWLKFQGRYTKFTDLDGAEFGSFASNYQLQQAGSGTYGLAMGQYRTQEFGNSPIGSTLSSKANDMPPPDDVPF